MPWWTPSSNFRPIRGRPRDPDRHLQIEWCPPALKREAAIRRLGDDVQATTVQKTGVIDVAVTTRNPALSLQVSTRLIELLNQFNLESRQTQAGAERRFTEQRLGEVKGDLRAAEDQLQHFLQRNREYRNAPELNFQQERLQRQVQLQQQLYTTLSQSFEQAKIEEVRDTPVITVVEPPEAPVRPDPRGLDPQRLPDDHSGNCSGNGAGDRPRVRGKRPLAPDAGSD